MSSIFKASFSASGYGSNSAYCTALSFGTSIEGDEAESRNGSTFYPKRVTSSSFSLAIAFPSHREWHDFIEWMKEYVRVISDPSSRVGPMTVRVPARSFSRVAIPASGFQFGDRAGALVRRSRISFTGASDPLRPGDRGTSSEPGFAPDTVVAQFYPTGTQASGAVEDSLYNGKPSDGGDYRLEALARQIGGG